MAKITYPDKSTGGSLFATEANEIKSVVNEHIEATASTGATIAFDIPRNYGNTTSPITGNIAFDFTGALLGKRVIVCHNDSSEPTLPAQAIVMSGSYVTGSDNYLEFIYFSSNLVLVTYISNIGGGDTSGLLSSDFTNDLTQKTTIEGSDQIAIGGTQKVLVDQIRESVIEEETDDYTIQATDVFKTKEINKATAVTVTIPPNSSTPIAINSTTYVRRTGLGEITFVEGSEDVTITSSSGALTDAGPNALMSLTKKGTNEWYLDNGLPLALASSDITDALGYTPANANNAWTRVTLTADHTAINSTTLVDITGLALPVVAGKMYQFWAEIIFDVENTTEGIALSINGPTQDYLTFQTETYNAPNGTMAIRGPNENYNDYDLQNGSNKTGNIFSFKGYVEPTADGNLQLRIRVETGTYSVTVKKGSYIEYRINQ